MIIQFIVAAVASMSFSILLQVPRRMYLLCAIGGGISWITFHLVLQISGLSALACFSAALLLTLFARITSVACKTPVIVFLTAGIFPLVPGAGVYYTTYSIIAGNAAAAVSYGTETLIVAGTIALGILFGFAPPQALFAYIGRPFARKPRG